MELEKKIEIKAFLKTKNLKMKDIHKEIGCGLVSLKHTLSIKKDYKVSPVFDKMVLDWFEKVQK